MSPYDAWLWALQALAGQDLPVIAEPHATPMVGASVVVGMPSAQQTSVTVGGSIQWECQIAVDVVAATEAQAHADLLGNAQTVAELLIAAGGSELTGEPGSVSTGAVNPLPAYTIRVTAP